MIAVLILGIFPLRAEDISVEATVNATTVELGESIQLTLNITGADDVPAVQLPKVDGLETRFAETKTKIFLSGNKMLRSSGLVFTIIPLKTGQFEISALTIPIKGKDYTTKPITITVVNSGNTNSTQLESRGTSSSLQDKIFIVLGTSKKESYIGEPIPMVIKLFINDLNVQSVQYPTFSHDGFTVEDFTEPRRGQQTLGDITYQVMEFRTLLYPTRTGDLSLGPAKLGANILIKNSRRQGIPGEFNNIFSDDLFDNFIGRYETKTIMLESANLGLKILPLPQEGKPADFSGGVGKYNFDMTVSPSEIKVGDPLTVRMRIAGDGNLKAVNMPIIKDSKDFKVYDPKIVEQNGEKVLEQVIIPNHDKITQLPTTNFSFFDPVEKIYRTVTKGPFPLTVLPLAKGEEAKIVGMTSPSMSAEPVVTTPEELGRDIHFIKEAMGRLQKRGFVIYQSGWFVGMSVLAFLVWIGLFLNYEFRKKFTADTRLVRRWQAPRQAKNGLNQAAAFLAQNDVRNFYDTLYKTLQDYFANKCHLPSASITADIVAEHFKNHSRKEEFIDHLKVIFAECELVRFASIDISEEKMKTTLRLAEEIIDFSERNTK
ncbi:MAG: protein BatD [Candidatus Omnitrophica bacterium]|nr:protein BatD [Candidatus Omnitrophota bacterium]